ncbi:MAG: helix-turn-helix domain-containing protein [Thermoflexales bacterium]|nr:helix-turn-helix domain-containing protein [Thermoflexales bacterium]MDW8053082.1 helix-turn-helix domain-containing protein [Anaerolineae bacterium]MDW8291735.1 helix-turn-helix domain-containing protein [Anaerolineae bacterium]
MQDSSGGKDSLSFGELLRLLRRRAGLTQRDLGIAVGYSEAHIARLESNTRTPDPVSVRARFLEALGIEGTPEAEQLVALAHAAKARVRRGRRRASELAQGAALAPAARLEATLEPLRSLPVPLAELVDRQREMEDLKVLLQTARLLTLHGSGGVGKSHLALHLAAAVAPWFREGVYWVELALISDASLVSDAVAMALGLRPAGADSQQLLIEFLHSKHVLLVLDGCERAVDAVASLVLHLLRACPQLSVLATSREVLGVPGEITYPIEGLAPQDAAALFVARALAARPELELSEADRALIHDICAQLDGLPLAIELAASRVRAMTISQIAERLADRFRLLSGGTRPSLPHHQTLRTLIDWSYDLLSEPERMLLRRLGVFVGGWTLEAAEFVCADPTQEEAAPQEAQDTAAHASLPPSRVLELLLQLVNKSLVSARDEDGQPRYYLSNTLRQYALERLAEAGEDQMLRTRHTRYYFDLADRILPFLGTSQQKAWLLQFEREKGNFRAALNWVADGHEREMLERHWNGLHAFWARRGYWAEGFKWLSFLAEHTPLPALRAEAMFGAGFFAWRIGNYERAYTLARIGSDIAKRLSDARLLALFSLLNGILSLPCDEARVHLEEGLRIAQQAGLYAEAAGILAWLAKHARVHEEDLNAAERFCHAGIRLAQMANDRYREIQCTGELGLVFMAREDYATARTHIERCVHFMREMGDSAGLADWIMPLSQIAFRQGDFETVRALVREGISLQQRFSSGELLPHFLMIAGALAQRAGQLTTAVHLLSQAAKLRDRLTLHNQLEPLRYKEVRERIEAVRALMDDTAFTSAWYEGQEMSTSRAVDEALKVLEEH